MPQTNLLQRSLLIPKDYVPFILILLNFATGLAIDIYTPCIPAIQAYFNTTPFYVRLTMVMLSTAATFGIPFWGPLSDRFGRKLVLLVGQMIFIIGLIGAITASSIEELIFFRFIQGVGTSSIGSVSFAMIGDWFTGPQRIAYFSYIGATITLTLVIGPLIGACFYDQWQWCFGVVLIIAIPGLIGLSLCPESLHHRQPFNMVRALRAYWTMAKTKECLGYAILAPLLIGALITFAINGAFYYMTDLGIRPHIFSRHQAFVMMINTLASISAGRLVHRWGETNLLRIAMGFLACASVGLTIVWLSKCAPVVTITGLIALIATSLGLSFSIYINRAMAAYPQAIGAVSSFLSLLRSLIIATTIALSGWFYDHTVASVTVMPVMISLAVLVIIQILGAVRRS